ncbi:methyltransferase domain-containing protein [Bacillus subtilis]|nr:methyltransferase domain-containing protein [Bacillus subtilis]MED3474616.1 methyltransferase domain-containing protein [Bacillus subtilis]
MINLCHLQNEEYMNQMNSSLGDKERMLQWINGDKVLDSGCGSGVLTEALYSRGYKAHGIDLSLLSYKEMRKRGLVDKFIHGNLLDMSIYFDECQFDTVIFSSVLHEVYSYNGFEKNNIVETLRNALKIIKSGGRIIIRDGVKCSDNKERIIRFKDKNDALFLTEYCRRFKGREILYQQVDKYAFSMDANDAMEFLYTFTWGWDSFEREVQEQYGVFSLEDYKNLAIMLGAKVVHAEEYLQLGYKENLLEKIDYLNKDGHHVSLPNSNMLLVLEK